MVLNVTSTITINVTSSTTITYAQTSSQTILSVLGAIVLPLALVTATAFLVWETRILGKSSNRLGNLTAQLDRTDRIQSYHKKLANRVFKIWLEKTLVRSAKLTDDFPESRDKYYLPLKFDSEDDADGRYLKDAEKHLAFYSALEAKTKMQQDVLEYNGRVKDFATWHSDMAERLSQSSGLSVDRSGGAATLPRLESFNIQGVYEFLEDARISPSDTNLERETNLPASPGVIILRSKRGNSVRTVAQSNDQEKITNLLNAIKNIESEYDTRVAKILDSEAILKKDLEGFKSKLRPVILDIDDGLMSGKCSIEERLGEGDIGRSKDGGKGRSSAGKKDLRDFYLMLMGVLFVGGFTFLINFVDVTSYRSLFIPSNASALSVYSYSIAQVVLTVCFFVIGAGLMVYLPKLRTEDKPKERM